MDNYPNHFFDKLWVLFVCILIIASPFILLIVIASVGTHSVQAQGTDALSSDVSMDTSGSPNLVTNGMSLAAARLSQTMDSASFAARSSIQSVASATTQSGKVVAHGAQIGIDVPGRVIGSGLSVAGDTISKGGALAARMPRDALKFVSKASALSSVIRPADHVQVPIIDPGSPELQAALKALPPAKDTGPAAPPQSNAGPAWPIHGAITTEFGVAHWPYQPTHTGLDISDGQRPGVTAVKPFRPGQVIAVLHSSGGLGNHIIVDHGNGVTSVYGHLAATSVQVGQSVTLSTTLGLEGSTGASTGTHLHFEIRVNGQAANPHQFISGHP